MTQNTSKFRLDFVGLGFAKCGSGWIYTLLQEHPDICMSYPKETSFFIFHDPEKRPALLKHYQKFFPGCGQKRTKGEIDPKYIITDRAFRNIKKFYPDSKFLVMLRDPVEKIISEYIFARIFTKEEPDLEEMIRKDLKEGRIASPLYIDHLKKWYNSSSQNFYIMILEEAIKDPAGEISRLYNFLGVDDQFTPPSLHKPVNTAKRFRHPFLQKMLSKVFNGFVKRHPLLFHFTEKVRFRRLYEAIGEWNRKEYDKPTISKETKDMLYKHYEPEIEELEQLLNKDLSIWKNKYK